MERLHGEVSSTGYFGFRIPFLINKLREIEYHNGVRKSIERGDIGKNGLLFMFSLGLCKLLNAVYLFMYECMFKKRLVYAVL